MRLFEQQSIYLHTDLNLVLRYRRGLYQRQRPSYLCTTFSMTSKFFKKKKEKKKKITDLILLFFVYFFMDINGTKIFVVVRVSFSMLFCGVEV